METADHVTYSGVRERPYLIPSEITALRPQRSFTASISCVNHHPVILNQSTATRWVGICYPHPIRLHHTIEFLLSCDFQLTIQNIFSMESKEWFSCFRLIFFFFFLHSDLQVCSKYNIIHPKTLILTLYMSPGTLYPHNRA